MYTHATKNDNLLLLTVKIIVKTLTECGMLLYIPVMTTGHKQELPKGDIMSGEIMTSQERLKEDIILATDEFISRLHNPDDIYKPSAFNGLIMYIYSTCVCGVHNDFTPIDINDIPTMYTLWNYYVALCSEYDKTPTIVQFSLLLGVNKNTLYTWLTSNTKSATKAHKQFGQIVMAACESATLGRTIDQNSIGAMFAMKAIFGVNEQNTTVLEVRNTSEQNAQEISAKYRDMLVDNNANSQGSLELSEQLASVKE